MRPRWKICVVICLAILVVLQVYNICMSVVKRDGKRAKRSGLSRKDLSQSDGVNMLLDVRNYALKNHRDKMDISDGENPYDFLYGQTFEDALERAASLPRKTILFWHTIRQKSLCFSTDLGRNCGYCKVRDELSLIEDNATEAVIFVFGYTKPDMMPKRRNLNQYWIWRTAEPPPGMMINEFLPIADNIEFNMTMTHRDNSDIRMPYNEIRNFNPPDPRATLKVKTDLAMVAISNCDLLTGCKLRLAYIRMLMQAGMKITTVGGCFPGSSRIPKPSDYQPDPMMSLVSRHKFYFSFENSYHCKDYITEKFFRPVQAGTVPVVWGGKKEDYLRFIPESGFIFVEDYESVHDLYKHLVYLDKNDDAYLEYFRWTKSQPVNYREQTFLCHLCRFLHGIQVDEAYRVPLHLLDRNKTYISSKPPRKYAGNITEWYTQKDNPECIRTDLELDSRGKVFGMERTPKT